MWRIERPGLGSAVVAGPGGSGTCRGSTSSGPLWTDRPRWPGSPGGCATWPRSPPDGRLRGIGRRYLTDPRLRMLLDRYATYAGADPRHAPAALVAIPYAELTFGGWYVNGGIATLADALARRCNAAWA